MPAPVQWLEQPGGIVQIGATGDTGFCFDNELPRHAALLQPHAIASRPVTNAEFLDFIRDGGYRTPALWLAEGWDWIGAQGITHPFYWRQTDVDWQEFTLAGLQTPDPPPRSAMFHTSKPTTRAGRARACRPVRSGTGRRRLPPEPFRRCRLIIRKPCSGSELRSDVRRCLGMDLQQLHRLPRLPQRRGRRG
jgi:formylglycine-generating enzyme required for sulfatase activity